jgi:hypothetical protein
MLNIIGYLAESGVPEITLWRATSPSKIWNSAGAIEEIRPQDAGFNDQVLSLIATPGKSQLAQSDLEQKGLVVKDSTWSLKLSPQGRDQIDHADSRTWMLQALILICHSFPLDQDLEPL